ncbi:MAG: tetraacyldisaccharide 4'-kinase [Nitrospinae bacterium]|nr:tetraacyldisaccharide 4'-kinase [Nitrospinota bacterium]
MSDLLKIRPTSKGLAGFFFIPLSILYGAAVRLRLFAYSLGFPRAQKTAGVKVISVGNITAGGTGKTPVVVMVVKMLGGKVAVVSRGYGRTSKEPVQIVSDGNKLLAEYPEAGDEAMVTAGELKGTPVICSPNRNLGIGKAVKLGAKTVVLDDAFSHLSAHRDKNILLTDALDPFGGKRLLPAGTLREPLSSIARADCVVITRANFVSDELLNAIREEIIGYAKKDVPLFLCDVEPANLTAPDGSFLPLSSLMGKNVALLSGLGSPVQFAESVKKLGATVARHFVFADHHRYNETEIRDAANLVPDGEILLTTRKDLVRVPDALKNRFHILSVEARVRDEKKFLDWLTS